MLALLSACLAPAPVAAEPPTTTIPEATPPPAGPGTPIATALAAVPAEVAARFALSLSADRRTLTVDPAPPATRDLPARRGLPAGVEVSDSGNGGKNLSLAGGPFRNGAWVQGALGQRITEDRRGPLGAWDLGKTRWLLQVDGDREAEVTTLAFSVEGEPAAVLAICHEVSEIVLATPSRPISVRKPVIYLDPEVPTRVRVDVALSEGAFTVRWPEPDDDGWDVLALPGGRLLDRAGRSHRYLFWEAEREPWALDPRRAHLVAKGGGAAFLERVCGAAALRDEECDDLVTFWLPELEAHPYTLVEWLGAPYTSYAQLEVDPAPDRVIRVFLLLQPSDHPVAVGAPPLPKAVRQGFTVVEWGGAVLE